MAPYAAAGERGENVNTGISTAWAHRWRTQIKRALAWVNGLLISVADDFYDEAESHEVRAKLSRIDATREMLDEVVHCRQEEQERMVAHETV